MSFPARSIINDRFNITYKQFGNSIEINVLKSITENIIKLNVLSISTPNPCLIR